MGKLMFLIRYYTGKVPIRSFRSKPTKECATILIQTEPLLPPCLIGVKVKKPEELFCMASKKIDD
jgi:hypothetical protein